MTSESAACVNKNKVIDPFQYNVQEAGQGIEESNANEEVGTNSGEGADQSDEIQSFRNICEESEKLMVKIT